MKTEHIVNIFKENKVGLTAREISLIYEKEYDRVRKLNQVSKSNQKTTNKWKEWLLNPKRVTWGTIGWGLAIIFFILTIFRNVLEDWLTKLVKTIGEWLYHKLAGSPLLLRTSLRRYQQALVASYRELHIPFRPNRTLDMGKVYVPLKFEGRKDSEQINAKIAIAEYPRLMVKGAPGSGKSMLLKHIAFSYGEGKLLKLPEQPIPILLELHRLTDPNLNEEKLRQQLVAVLARHDFPKAEQFVEQGLEQGKLMLLFDGLDEVNSDVRRQVVQVIKDLLNKYKKCRSIVTCRTAVYQNEFTEVVNQTLELVEFSDRQIRRFLGAWEMPPDKSIEQLIQTLRDRPKIMALARNPLLLTIIAYLYTYERFVLPHSRAEFYQKATDILLRKWDEENQRLNQYRGNDKRRVLQHLALYAQDNSTPQQQDRRSIPYEQVLEQVQRVLPDLNLQPDKDTKPILKEIVDRSGLLLRIDGGERYQFAHLTLQEYFTAAALVDQRDELIGRFNLDSAAWREIVKLWCGLASNSTALIETVYEEDALTGFECLADAQEVDQGLAERIIIRFQGELGRAFDEDNGS